VRRGNKNAAFGEKLSVLLESLVRDPRNSGFLPLRGKNRRSHLLVARYSDYTLKLKSLRRDLRLPCAFQESQFDDLAHE
jgi:hypothetical protein